ncbi:MAG: tetratricopeptide repeat protein [Anaerolineaceae bacterium]|nr:tetratricopeptide repeat protein [Anaerolineaceae bacterium]
MPSATVTVAATPTFILTPLSAATLPLTSTPEVTATLTVTAVPTFLPTPESQPATYQLKEWTEQDALDLVSEMQTRIDPVDWDSDIGYASEIERYQYSHRPLEIAAYEAILRFPTSSQMEKVAWQRVLATTQLGITKNNPSQQIEAMLEAGLNQGIYHHEAWAQFNDFTIRPVAEVENLLGDGRTIPIYKIQTNVSGGDDGLYFALDVLESQSFDVIPIVDLWNEGNAFWKDTPVFADHTGDGIPEAALSIRFQSGTMCATTVLVLQWQGTQFVNLAKQPDGQGISLPLCWDEWQFLPAEVNGAQPIQLNLFHFLSDRAATWMEQVYVWDQSHYVLRDTTILPISGEDPLEWIDYNVAIGEWETAVQAIDDLLNQWGINPPSSVHPSYPDFLRFQQGWLYAVHSQVEDGRAALQQLIDEPVNPITPTLSLAAQAFLNVYQTDSDIYESCSVAKQVMLDAFAEPSSFSSDYLASWGYTQNGFPCDSTKAWEILQDQTTFLDAEDAVTFLKVHGVSIVEVTFMDLDGDEHNETLFTRESNDLYGPGRITYAIFTTESGLEFVPLDFDATTLTKWETEVPQGDNPPLHFVQITEALHIFQVNIQSEERTVQRYVRYELLYNVENFALDQQENGLVVTVNFLPTTYRFHQLTFRWNPAVEDFETAATDVPYFLGTSPYMLVERAKVMLFEEQRFEETAVMLSYYTANYEANLSEAYYLLALAYELSGQEQQAVETYWQLWHDFPEDSFAIMARRKVVPAEP